MPAQPQQNIEQQAHDLSVYALQAYRAGLQRYAEIESLRAAAASYGIDPRTFSGGGVTLLTPQLVAAHAAADKDLRVYVQAIRALKDGTAKLARWKTATGSLVWGVVKVAPSLGQLPYIVAVVAGAATAIGWWLLDLWGSAQKIEATAHKLRAETHLQCQQNVAALAKAGHTSEAAALGQACATAAAAADKPAPGLLDSLGDKLLTGAEVVAAAGAAGGLIWLVAAYALSRRGKSKKKKSWHVRSPFEFHRPVSFQRPVYRS